ncbi:MAG TPA: outer membrane lipoprotein carrier protein LolA [Pyrinomonadaceae bacterium]|jgi:outer membrane lipoprotein-sorting protein|nr:outer membrane lipoprotein carrier protein LolA [Pyrinomonadaceae bacterium]
MKKLFGLSLGMAMLVMLAVGSPQEASGQSAGLVSSVLNRMEQNRQSLKSLRAGISMEKYNSQLRNSERLDGVIAYTPASGRGANVRIEWNKPHEILTVNNGTYWLYKPRLSVVYTGHSNSRTSGGITEMMNMSRQQLTAKFEPFQDVREETIWGGVSTIHLRLVPKGSASFKYAEIWVDSSGMPVQTKIVEKNDDATTVRLNNLERNVKISSDVFSVKYDSNVKVIKS